jgi:hypothetical protein
MRPGDLSKPAPHGCAVAAARSVTENPDVMRPAYEESMDVNDP